MIYRRRRLKRPRPLSDYPAVTDRKPPPRYGMSKGHELGLRLRRLWWHVKYFLNGDTRRDKRERKAWARKAKKAMMSRIADDLNEEREARRRTLKTATDRLMTHPDRPYKNCMKQEHFDVIMRNRVVEAKRGGRTVYEVNIKGMDAWEVDEFWAMLREKIKLHRPTSVITAIESGRFPQ